KVFDTSSVVTKLLPAGMMRAVVSKLAPRRLQLPIEIFTPTPLVTTGIAITVIPVIPIIPISIIPIWPIPIPYHDRTRGKLQRAGHKGTKYYSFELCAHKNSPPGSLDGAHGRKI